MGWGSSRKRQFEGQLFEGLMLSGRQALNLIQAGVQGTWWGGRRALSSHSKAQGPTLGSVVHAGVYPMGAQTEQAQALGPEERTWA